jgi:hypothetical protein
MQTSMREDREEIKVESVQILCFVLGVDRLVGEV